MEKRILQLWIKEIKNLLQHAPQLEVFKMKNLLTLIVENFFSEMKVRSYDMPLQLQFDFAEQNFATLEMPSPIIQVWNLI